MVEHVVVIGAGVYGAAVAAGLTRRGARVTVVDGGAPAGGTSGATFSWTNALGKEPRSYHDFCMAGMEAHRRLASRGDWYHETGNLQWTGRQKVAHALDYGYEAEWLTRQEALRLEPGLDPGLVPDDGIAFFPREGWLDPPRLVGRLLTDSGCELVHGDAVTGLEVADAAVRAVLLASGRRLPADAVVNCAGPQAARIAAMAGLSLPMRNTRGILVRTSSTAVQVSHVIHATDVHLRPEGDGRLLLHAPQVDEVADIQSAADTTLAHARALYPGLANAAVEEVRVGERPIPADGLPVLGRARDLPNFHFAVSHSGATLCLHAGDLVAAEALGDDQSAALSPYRHERS
jgi:glycine/D-amino acid oxidase-like deaminating enzyme